MDSNCFVRPLTMTMKAIDIEISQFLSSKSYVKLFLCITVMGTFTISLCI